MTSQGSLYGQFKRALERGNALSALGLARELPKLSLADALALCLVLRDETDYPKYATRWHARFVTELGLTSWTESQLVLTSLLSLGGTDASAGVTMLRTIFGKHGRDDLVQQLELRARMPASRESRDVVSPADPL